MLNTTTIREKKAGMAMKRAELHTHTKYSKMDGLIDIRELLTFAASEGMRAVALTDHENIDAFSEAEKIAKEMKEEGLLPQDFKIIYGAEVYLVDDLKPVAKNEKNQKIDADIVIIDIETTGFSAEHDKIIELSAIKVSDGTEVDSFSALINPGIHIPEEIAELTGINDEMVKDKPLISEVLPEFLHFIGDSIVVGHNGEFDFNFISANAKKIEMGINNTLVDTVPLCRLLLPEQKRFKLESVVDALEIEHADSDRTIEYVRLTMKVYLKLMELLKSRGIQSWKQVNESYIGNPDVIKNSPSYHATILVKNQEGMNNLKKIVQTSNDVFYERRARVPKSFFYKHRDGLLIGSACEAGMLHQSILNEKTDEEISEVAKYFDYLEIQPLSNNKFMCDSQYYDQVNSEEDLMELNKKIIEIGKATGIPVVATCDAHYLIESDYIARTVLYNYRRFSNVFDNNGLYVRTTEEMLNEFHYWGDETAFTVVVENTNQITDMIECDVNLEQSEENEKDELSEMEAEEILIDFMDEYGMKLDNECQERVVKLLNGLKYVDEDY